MTVISDSIPRFTAGVSQQPDKLKRSDQLRSCVNGYPSPVQGLIKRYPTINVGKLISGDIGSAKCLFTVKDSGERYVTIASSGNLRVFDLNGTAKTVSFPDGKSYLSNLNPRYDLSGVTIGDYTFILNKTKQTAMTADIKQNNYPNSAIIYVKSGKYSSDYKIYINDVEKATYSSDTTDATIKTNFIAVKLVDALNTNLAPLANNWNIARRGSVILLQNLANTDFDIRVEDSNGNNCLYAFKDVADAITDLPDVAPNGFTLKIQGKKESKDDDYYVGFKCNNQNATSTTFSKGGWLECAGVGVKTTIDKSTMPYALIRKSDGTFSFETIPYTLRSAGDDYSNEIPSFIGSSLNEMFVYKNRLGLLSGESICLSSIKDIFSWFKETTLTDLDTDPIDVTATTGKRGDLRYVLPYNLDLLIFTALSQYILKGSGVLTSKTISIDLTTEFENSLKCTPVNAGNNVFFTFERNNFTGLRQFYTNQNYVNDAEDLTSWVPTYIPKNVYKIISSTLEDVNLFLTEEEPNSIYVYKYLFSNGENKQTSHCKWEFSSDAKIIGGEFVQSTLYLVVQYPDGVYLEKIDMTPGLFDIDYTTTAGHSINFLTRLDRKITNLNPIYDADSNETLFIFPYNPTNGVQIINKANGLPLTILDKFVNNGCLVCVASGDHTDKDLIAGTLYDHYFELPTLYYRSYDRINSKLTVVDGNLQILDLYLNYGETSYFQVDVTPLYQDTITFEFTGITLGTPTAELNTCPITDGEFPVPVLCKNTEVDIVIRNNTYRPSAFLDGSFEADYSKVIGV